MCRRVFRYLGGVLVLSIGALSFGSSDVDVTHPKEPTGWVEAFGSANNSSDDMTTFGAFDSREVVLLGNLGEVVLLGHVD